jgi:hypothetical protein
MKTIITAAALAAAVLVAPATVNAQEAGCYIGDYQGAPVEICPEPIPDPTNCYTGDYQGAPIEICMPTGWQPDPSWTYQGKPIVMHVSKDYVAPVTETPAPVVTAPAPAPVVELTWLDELQAVLVANGGW